MDNFEVMSLYYNELSEDEKRIVPDNGCGAEWSGWQNHKGV